MYGNVIEYERLVHVRSGQSLDFKNETSLRVVDDLVYNYVSTDTAFPVENGVYYSNSKFMSETSIDCSVQLYGDNDMSVKNFLNYKGDAYAFYISVNGLQVVAFCEIGNQSSRITETILKEYTFTIRFTTRFMKEFRVTGGNTASLPTPSVTNGFDVGTFDNEQYDIVQVSSNSTSFIVNNPDYEDIYISFSGEPITTDPVEVIINNSLTIQYNNPGIDNTISVVTIPSLIGIYINDTMSPGLLPLNNSSNFYYPLDQATNIVKFNNLQNIQFIAYEVVNII